MSLKVAAVSENTNSFGLRQMVLLKRDGTTFTACANSLNLLDEGTVISEKSLYSRGFELIHELPTLAPASIVTRIWE